MGSLLRRSRSSRGFTLIELVVALAVFGIITVSVISLVTVTQEAQRSEHYLDLANTAARQIVEQARNGSYDALQAGETYDRTDFVSEQLPEGEASLQVSASSDLPDFKRLDVDVSYKVGSLTRHAYASAIIGKGGITP